MFRAPRACPSLAAMLAHAGGAATIDAPVWLLAYGAAALLLLVTVTLRGRMLAEGTDPAVEKPRVEPGIDDGGIDERRVEPDVDELRAGEGDRGTTVGRRLARFAGQVAGVGLLMVVVAAALFGPAASAANLAPSTVLSLWWVGLPLACIVLGDVMGWLDPFGTLARPLAGTRSGTRAPRATAAALLAIWAWWVLAYHDGRDPRALGWFLVVYTLAAVGGAVVWGRPWLRRGEAFGALSSTLARTRSPGRHPALVTSAALVAVWLGATAFDLFSGTRAWVDLAATSTGWARTARATGCLAAGIGLAWLVVVGTGRLAGGAGAGGAAHRVREAAVRAWSAVTAGVFVGHGIPLLLLDGQFAVSLASDPFGRGWDVFETASRTIDYSPLSPGLVGVAQLTASIGGAVVGVVAAVRLLRSHACPAGRVALRALWVVGVAMAVAAAAGVAVLSADLE